MGSDGGEQAPSPFHIRDCAQVLMATGYHALTLRELREGLLKVHSDSIYHHFWGRLLQPGFDEPEYMNDFASWVRRGLHEKALAERMAMIAPTDFSDIEGLRGELVETVEEFLDQHEYGPWARADQQFYFLRSQLIVLDTGRKVEEPERLGKEIVRMPFGSIFYHFVDARRRRPERIDDIFHWLSSFGDRYQPLMKKISAIDPYFSSLKALRHWLTEIFEQYDWGGSGG